jgi:hypothetical protein
MGERELNDYSSATDNSGRIWRLGIRQIPSEVVLTPEDGVPKVCAFNLDHV